MKVAVYDYRGCRSGFQVHDEIIYDDKPQVINDVEFDDALRMIHPDAAWMWDRDNCQLHNHQHVSSDNRVVVGAWGAGLGCVISPCWTRYVFNGQRWKIG